MVKAIAQYDETEERYYVYKNDKFVGYAFQSKFGNKKIKFSYQGKVFDSEHAEFDTIEELVAFVASGGKQITLKQSYLNSLEGK